VVIAIIAVLIGILMPALAKARSAANDIVCASNLRQVTQACLMYSGDNRGYLVPNFGTTQGYFDLNQGKNLYGSGLLVYQKLVTPRVFYSPVDPQVAGGGAFSYELFESYWQDIQNYGYFKNGWPPTLFIRTSTVFREPGYDMNAAAPNNNFNQTKFQAGTVTYPYLFTPEKLSNHALGSTGQPTGRMSLVSDRFCGSGSNWSFHGGIEAQASVSGIVGNGRGWHVGFSDGSVVFVDNDPKIYNATNTVGASKGWQYRFRNWTYWDANQ
jgi:hypothetical protein